jgi:hypothetical protein
LINRGVTENSRARFERGKAPQKLYFAAPLFSDMKRRFNSELAEELEQFFDVLLPRGMAS